MLPQARRPAIVACLFVLGMATFSFLSFAQTEKSDNSSATARLPVDELIPWLLHEDGELRGIPFSEVIFDATGKRVLPFNRNDETDARVLRQISAVLDSVMERLNAPGSVIQQIGRINEVSSHFEDLMRQQLNAVPGLQCDFPKTADGRVQRSRYPDLRLVDEKTGRVYYLDPKL